MHRSRISCRPIRLRRGFLLAARSSCGRGFRGDLLLGQRFLPSQLPLRRLFHWSLAGGGFLRLRSLPLTRRRRSLPLEHVLK